MRPPRAPPMKTETLQEKKEKKNKAYRAKSFFLLKMLIKNSSDTIGLLEGTVFDHRSLPEKKRRKKEEKGGKEKNFSPRTSQSPRAPSEMAPNRAGGFLAFPNLARAR
jgi:hypothetical protein